MPKTRSMGKKKAASTSDAVVPATKQKKKPLTVDTTRTCSVVLKSLTETDISKLKVGRKIHFDEKSIEKNRYAVSNDDARPSTSTHESRHKSRQMNEYRRRRSSSYSSGSSVERKSRYRSRNRDLGRRHSRVRSHSRGYSQRYRQYSSDSSSDYYGSRSHSRNFGHRRRNRVSRSPSPDRKSRHRSSYRRRHESRSPSPDRKSRHRSSYRHHHEPCSPSSDSNDGRKSRSNYRRDSSSPDGKRPRYVSPKVDTPIKVTPKKRAVKTTPTSTPRAKRNQTNVKKGNGRGGKSPAAAIVPAKRTIRSKSVAGELFYYC